METLEAATGHPYRNKPTTRTPVVSGRARKLAAHGVGIVLVCLVFRWLALIFSSKVVIAAELFLVLGTWLFTLRCEADNRAARGLGWLLRILAAADSGIVIGNSLQLTSLESLHLQLGMTIVPVAGLLFMAARVHSFGLPELAKKLITAMAICFGSVLLAMAGSLINVYLSVLFMITAVSLYVALWFWGVGLLVRMRRMLRIDAHEWWLDVEALPQVEWTSYARLGDGRVELIGAGGGTCWFDSYAEAIFWLDRAGFCPQEQALAQGLVDQPPAQSLARPPHATSAARSLAQSY